MGIDPVGVDENNVHSHNRYAYANNNPYRFVDPDGRLALPIAILGAGLATAGIIYYWDKTFGAILQNSSNSNSDETAKLLGLGNSTASSGGMLPPDDDDEKKDRTKHGQQRADEAKTDANRNVGDANRVIKEGRQYLDNDTGNNVHVSGNRVVITNEKNEIVSQFKNPRANTNARIQSGRWSPKE